MNLLSAERMFVPYGPSHWALLMLILVGSLLLGVLGNRYRGTAGSRIFSRMFALAIVAFQVPLLIYMLLPPRWSLTDSLPLHLCDLAWMAAAWALWSESRVAYSLTYYWGLTLTPQAMITPALDAPDFPHIDFIEFWGQHLLVVWAAVYLTWGIGLRPDWRGYRVSVGITVFWGIAMLSFNEWAGTNYGFLNSKPSNPSLLDLMGGWPWYLGVELLAGLIGWALVTLPWRPNRVRLDGAARGRTR